MRLASNARELMDDWSEFLVHIQRLFARLAKATESGSSKGWFDRIQNQRREDPLLSYVAHARNVDEHGVEPITRRDPGGIGINPKTGNVLHIGHISISRGTIVVDPETARNIRITFVPERVALVAVRDRGREYPVPNEHLGRPLSGVSLINVAELALAFWGRTLAEAAQKFG
jgi:hypothetical protein